jgi:uncharacterized membrane-anchored protein YitT (DUF2179 family)
VNAVLIVLGILAAGMGLKGFLLSSGFIDGGVTGACMLLARTTGLPLALTLPLVNVPFVALAWRQLGRAFAVRSTLAIAGLALVLAVVRYPDVTPDPVLTAAFGGVFLGAGVGLAVRGGAVLDGTEIAALLVSRRSDLVRVGDVILGLNVVLFAAAIGVMGVEPALYSMLTYAAAAKMVDFIVHGIDEYTAITIVSDHAEAIRTAITRELGRGVTVYAARGGATGVEREILYCVVTRLEIGRVRQIVRSLDPAPFVVVHPLADVQGGRVKPVPATP